MKNVEAKELFKTLGQNVKYYRKLYNLKKGKLTQEKLAEEVDVCTALIGNLESENIDLVKSLRNDIMKEISNVKLAKKILNAYEPTTNKITSTFEIKDE